MLICCVALFFYKFTVTTDSETDSARNGMYMSLVVKDLASIF